MEIIGMFTMLVRSEGSVLWTAFRKFAWSAPSDCWGRSVLDCSFLCLFLSTHGFIEVVLLPNQFLLISAYGKIEDGMEIKIMLKNVRRISDSCST
jgi:hypothetical protein